MMKARGPKQAWEPWTATGLDLTPRLPKAGLLPDNPQLIQKIVAQENKVLLINLLIKPDA